MKHEQKSCPRCKGTFECKVGDVVNCQCSQVKISPETYQFISTTHYDCLCQKCLIDLNRFIALAKTQTFPKQRELMIEGLHYYKENGYWVFTELYHFLRGHCCKNGCRHCAYGYKKEATESISSSQK